MILALVFGVAIAAGFTAQADDFRVNAAWDDILKDPETLDAIRAEYDDPDFLLRYGGPGYVEPASKLCCDDILPDGRLSGCRRYVLICGRRVVANCPGGHECIKTSAGWVCECYSSGNVVKPSGNLINQTR
jgi:hypothetical protein